jgi:Pyruvate/2-oxoacid:ferredoxin oxidoreductase gamma subunit
VDRSTVDAPCERKDVQVVEVPAGEIARQSGSELLANVVLAGVYAALFPRYVSPEAGMAALAHLSCDERAHLLAHNQAALEAGYGYAIRHVTM